MDTITLLTEYVKGISQEQRKTASIYVLITSILLNSILLIATFITTHIGYVLLGVPLISILLLAIGGMIFQVTPRHVYLMQRSAWYSFLMIEAHNLLKLLYASFILGAIIITPVSIINILLFILSGIAQTQLMAIRMSQIYAEQHKNNTSTTMDNIIIEDIDENESDITHEE